MKRRGFISGASKAGILGVLGINQVNALAQQTQQKFTPKNDEHTFLYKPYLQTGNVNEMKIMWVTNKNSYSWVEYGETEKLGQKVHRLKDGLVVANNRVNCIYLHNLKPNTTYYYRVVSKEITGFEPYKLSYGTTIHSSINNFRTANPKSDSVSWLVMNDIHDRPQSISHLMKLNGSDDYDFVFFNGDMFDYQTDEQQIIDHMLMPCAETFASNKPFMFVRGNHETRGRFARELGEYFSNPSGKYYFAFNRGPVYAIVLDTGEDKVDAHPVYGGIVDFDAYRKEQAVWLEQQMKSDAYRKAAYKVVMMHIPHHYSGDWHGPMHCREVFGPLFNKYKIDILIAGHTHTYGVHAPVKGLHNYPIIIGGGPKPGTRTLIKVKANGQSLKLQMLDDAGKEVGHYTIMK